MQKLSFAFIARFSRPFDVRTPEKCTYYGKLSLLLLRFRKPSAQELSWQHTYREMSASDENWSAWDAVVNDVLDNIEMSAKIRKYAGIAD